MASITPYPSGSDIIAPLPLYSPDFSAINTMMQKRAAMFEQGLSQVKSSDSLIRNAALSVSDNQVVRDQYIKQAEEQLKKLNGVDFSQIQNVEAAQQVYAPFWQDKELLEDYSKTSAINAERSRAESMAQSNDPKVREQFWQTGLQYVNLSAGDLSMAKRGDGSISKVRVNKYVPFFDAMEELKKRAKDQGLQIEIDSQGGPGNTYKITRTNGDAAVPLFKEWAANELSTMPQAEEVFRVQGAVDYRGSVQNYMAQGYDEVGAKRAVAERYMNDHKANLEGRSTELSGAITELQKKLDAMDIENKAKYDSKTLKPEEHAARQEVARQLAEYKKAASGLEDTVNKYKDPNSKEYQDEFNSLVNGGEDFFRRYHKNAMINSFARNQAINSKYKIDVDPVTKMNLDMQKEMIKIQQDADQFEMRYGNGGKGSSGSSSSSSSKADKVNPNDQFIYVGRSTMGNDPIAAQQRLKETYTTIGTKYLNSGISIINEAGMMAPDKLVSPAYQNYLKEVLLTGKYTPSKELEAEHKRLQDLNIIPKNLKFGHAPSGVYDTLYQRAVELLSAGSNAGVVSPSLFKRLQEHGRIAPQFFKLRDIQTEVERKFLNDPQFKAITKEGKLLTMGDFMRNNLGYSNKEAYVKNFVEQSMRAEPGAPSGGVSTFGAVTKGRKDMAEANWEKLENQYSTVAASVKGKVAQAMQRYLNIEGAVIGQEIELVTDRKEDRDLAQNIAVQAASTANMANQLVDKNGTYPINMPQLEQLGADREKIRELLDLTRGNIDNFIDKVRITKVGISGKPSVKLVYNMDEVKKLLGEKKFSSDDWQGTIRALNNGLELAVDQAQIDGFNQDFDLPGASDVAFDQNQMLKAPEDVKKFGFDYTILKDPASNQYIVNFQYKDGALPRQRNMYIPLSQPLSAVQSQLEDYMYKIYTGNQQALQKQGMTGNFITPTGDYNSFVKQ